MTAAAAMNFRNMLLPPSIRFIHQSKLRAEVSCTKNLRGKGCKRWTAKMISVQYVSRNARQISRCEIDLVHTVMSITVSAHGASLARKDRGSLPDFSDHKEIVGGKKRNRRRKKNCRSQRRDRQRSNERCDRYRACNTVAPTATPIARAPAAAAIATAGVSEKDRLYHGSVTAGAAVGSASMIRS
ncbi:MAG: hypothetical protein JWO39_2658 [Gemmatimonadetes bacterium]|nr:hypothetical protein [Gemmatimonadota bacterium]